MTDSEWLKYRSKVTGKSIEELRAEMRQRGSQAGSKRGFAAIDPEKMKEIGRKGANARWGKKDV